MCLDTAGSTHVGRIIAVGYAKKKKTEIQGLRVCNRQPASEEVIEGEPNVPHQNIPRMRIILNSSYSRNRYWGKDALALLCSPESRK